MPKYFWLVVFTMAIGASLAYEPPFHEGPEAQRQNQMSEEAPAGPWAWHGGD